MQRAYLALRKVLLFNQAEKLWRKFVQMMEDNNYFYYYPLSDQSHSPTIFTILNRAIHIASKERNKNTPDALYCCDLLVLPKIPKIPQWKRSLFLYFTDFTKTKDLYELGRSTAREYLPRLWQMTYEWEVKQAQTTSTLEVLIQNNDSARE